MPNEPRVVSMDANHVATSDGRVKYAGTEFEIWARSPRRQEFVPKAERYVRMAYDCGPDPVPVFLRKYLDRETVNLIMSRYYAWARYQRDRPRMDFDRKNC